MKACKNIRIMVAAFVVVLPAVAGLPNVGLAAATNGKSPRVLLQEGVYAEEIEGDLDGAIKIYQRIISEAEAARATAAQAVYRLGICYLKKGEKDKAAEQFQKVLSEFSNQKAIAEKANEQLDKIRPPEERIVEQAVMTISTRAEGDPRVTKALESLRGIDEDVVVGELNKFLDSKPDTVRRSAIYILWKGDFKDISAAVGRLQKLCSHKEDLTRGMAAIALGASKARSSFDTLCSMTLNDSSGYARRSAAYALGLLGRADAKSVLEEALKDSDKLVRDNAAYAIKMLPGEVPVVPAASFGPVIEQTAYSDESGRDFFFDLDTGMAFSPPAGLTRSSPPEKVIAWARVNGIDFVNDGGRLDLLDMLAVAVDEKMWESWRPDEVKAAVHKVSTERLLLLPNQSGDYTITKPFTYAFRTREGEIGLLQIVGKDEDGSLNIRYKMVQESSYIKGMTISQSQRESLRKLNILGKALLVYANDQDTGSYPDTLRALEKDYTTKEYVEWWLENVEYLGKGKTATDPPNTVIAYDKKLLQGGKGTNVLFNNGHVEFPGPKQLERLGILWKEATVVRKVFLPDSETANTDVVLDLASGEMLSAERFEKDRQYFKKLGKGGIVYEYAKNKSDLLCLRDGRLLAESGGFLKPDAERSDFRAYFIREVPSQYQFVTAEGDKYEIKIISVDAGDNGGCQIEYWKSGGRTRQEQAVKPAFKAVIYDNMALDLESGAAVPLEKKHAAVVAAGGGAGQTEWPKGFDVAWDNDGGGVLMVGSGSGARIIGLATIQQGQWPQAIAAVQKTIEVLKNSDAKGVLARQSRFAAVLTSEGNMAVVEITDFDAEKAKIEWRLEELPQAEAIQQGFGPVMKEFIKEDSSAIDFDTGRMFTIPKIVIDNYQAAMQWVVDNGIDAGADQELIGIDLAGERMPSRAWQQISASELIAVAGAAPAVEGQVIIPHSGEYPATYALRTREGGVGILQILDVTDAGVRVQYKMVRNVAAEAVDPNSIKKWKMGDLAELAKQARQEMQAKLKLQSEAKRHRLNAEKARAEMEADIRKVREQDRGAVESDKE